MWGISFSLEVLLGLHRHETLSGLLGRALAEAFTLLPDVVSQHGSKHKIFRGSEGSQGFVNKSAHYIETNFIAEVEIHLLGGNFLQKVRNVLRTQPLAKQLGTIGAHGAQHQLTNAFSVFVNLMHEQFHRAVAIEIFYRHERFREEDDFFVGGNLAGL